MLESASTPVKTHTINPEEEVNVDVSHKRILITKVGMDAHWRGAVVVARALRDAGFEVVFGGNLAPTSIVATAIQESVDYIGISSLSGSHLTTIPPILDLLRNKDAEDIKVVVGGIIPPKDAMELKRRGVLEVFGPGQSIQSIVDFLQASHATL
ncbi:MAG: cobalamin B12-binding domain-containing protein [Syntrophobacteraceae bacterium]|nr:cobalamin B12-binding domain-containing protein [Syntrophobacteraceae bacterium]